MIWKTVKILSIAFLMTFATRTTAQSLPQFPTDSAQWITHFYGYPGWAETDPEDYFDTIYCYSMHGDTSIASLNYKKLRMFKRSYALGVPTLSPEVLLGGIRYDSVLNQVYYYSNSLGFEELAYKFDLAPGSNFVTNLTPEPIPDSTVTRTVDSIINFKTYSGVNFSKNVRYYFHGECGWPGMPPPPAILNNIGSIYGLFVTWCPVEFNVHELQCFADLAKGDLPAFSPYDVLLSTRQKEKSVDVSVFPSPTQDQLHISLPGTDQLKEYSIFSIAGSRISRATISGIHCVIDVSALSNGLYFIEVTSENRTFVTKFIKE